LRKLHVLLVDDDPETCDRMAQALADGFLLRHVTSVADAKHYLREQTPDILICEAVIGQESGLELCRYLRARGTFDHLPVLLLTSRATISDKVAGFEAGADDYVVKPYDAHHLAARIRLLVRVKRLQYPSED
jgi:DNA-binding response OmpR family regulator